jgi:hypothetical protein
LLFFVAQLPFLKYICCQLVAQTANLLPTATKGEMMLHTATLSNTLLLSATQGNKNE